MRRALASPYSWLLVVAVLAAIVHWRRGDFATRVLPDTPSYRDFDFSSLAAALSQTRTVGYPAFLKALDGVGIGFDGVALAQFVVFALAVVLFCLGLRVAGFGKATAFAAAASLFLVRAAWDYVPEATADSLGLSLAIATAGVFFAAVSSRGNGWTIAALAASTFLTYQVRPVYVFLILLWPTLSFAFESCLTREADPLRVRLRRLALYAAFLVVPFLAFAGLRKATVGHFGVVSFDGFNFVGIAGQFLDQRIASDLPDDLRPLADEMLRRRPAVEEIVPPTDFAAMEASYDPTIYYLALPIARETYGEDHVAINDAFSRLSWTVLRDRPEDYVRWLLGNAKHAFKQCIYLASTDTATLAAVACLLLLHAWRLMVARKLAPLELSPEDLRRRRIEDHLLLWTAIGFCATKCGLVIFLQPAIGRYMTAAIVFLPPALAVAAARYAESLFLRRRGDAGA